MRPPYLILSALYCWVIFVASSDSSPPEVQIPHIDKAVHFVLFGGLAAIVSIGLRHGDRLPPPRIQFWAPVLFAAFYGATDEFHQLYVPNRSFSIADLLADTCGAVAIQSYLCFYLWRFRWNLAE